MPERPSAAPAPTAGGLGGSPHRGEPLLADSVPASATVNNPTTPTTTQAAADHPRPHTPKNSRRHPLDRPPLFRHAVPEHSGKCAIWREIRVICVGSAEELDPEIRSKDLLSRCADERGAQELTTYVGST